ncbi:MAG TPA: hypothetical protein VFT79_13750 [Solirubrobacterales bacterium]|nr:hypothetical protein [Solirubrobacterales bacterium]
MASYAGGGATGRIDVFNDEGKFITELADPNGPFSVTVDRNGNLYAFEQSPGSPSEIVRYTPSVYEGKAGNIEYSTTRAIITTNNLPKNGLAIDLSNDHLYIAQGDVVREYSSAVEGNKLLASIGSGELTASHWVAVDAQRRRLFASSCRENGIEDCVIKVFEADSPHSLIEEIDGSEVPAGEFKSTKGWTSIAVDEATGHFFVDDLELTKNVYEFDENFKYVETLTFSGFQGGNALQIGYSNAPEDEEAKNRRFLFVPVITAAGRALAFEPPGVPAPEILDLTAVNIGETEAELQARIDPENGATTYVIEYTTQQAFEEEGFAGATVAGEGTTPATGQPVVVSAIISGLSPGTAYRFRVRAENSGGKAEPVPEAGFTTYSDSLTGGLPCPNDALRIGPSALLPDCRAYELVTPPDTNGRPPLGPGTEGDRFGGVQSSPAGNAVSFEILGGALPGSEATGGFHGDLYRADRGPSGWGTTLTGPTSTQATRTEPGSTSPDQGFAFWVAGGEGSAVLKGVRTRYVRYPDGHSELIGRGSIADDPNASGRLITESGTHIVFQTDALNGEPIQLEPNAPPTGTRAVYDRTADEVTHVVSLLPGDITPAAGQHATYLGASADGEGIAFEIGTALYLRKENATTFQIGTGVTFAGVSEGGGRVFYVEGGDLKAFDTATEEVVAFSSTGDVTPVNVAPQGTRAYFVSPSVLGGANPNGAVAQAGEENLYLSTEGAISFLGTVTAEDVEGETLPNGSEANGLGLWTKALVKLQPATDPSRLTPDGSVLLFQSRAVLDGQPTGGDPQVFRYDSASNRLHCISCIPTGVPEGSGASLQSFRIGFDTEAPFSTYGFVPNLRADGKRAFFESEEALVSTDTDEVRDVYEWEAQGVGSCTRAGGCVYLISSGQSGAGDFLYGHSQSGDDVFFTTADSLTGSDAGGTVSIYDARVNGGFAEPKPETCQEVDPCRGQAPPGPSLPPATSEDLGRLQEPPPRKPRPCPKGKRKVKRAGKVVCVKKKKQRKHKQRRTGSNQRGAAR